MEYIYFTKGTCSSQITFDINDNVITNVRYRGGCNGNLQGISRLVEGKTVDEIESILKGVKCGFKSTSCPDQLAIAVREAQKSYNG